MPSNTSAPQSFIPHEATGVVRRGHTGLGDLFFLISIVLLVASLALAAGVFLYSGYLRSSSDSKVDQLERAKKAAFEPALIQELTRLDDRMRAASEVLQNHTSPSALFSTLEQGTITTVAFDSLELNMADAEDITVDMAGVAGSVNSIALQADLFSKSGMLLSPIFSNINRQENGVHFNLAGSIAPSSINYVRLLAAPAAVPEDVRSPFGAPAQESSDADAPSLLAPSDPNL